MYIAARIKRLPFCRHFQMQFHPRKFFFFIQTSLKFVSQGPILKKLALVQVMICRWHIYIIRPIWVNELNFQLIRLSPRHDICMYDFSVNHGSLATPYYGIVQFLSSLYQVIACWHFSAKPLHKPMLTISMSPYGIIRPLWVKMSALLFRPQSVDQLTET